MILIALVTLAHGTENIQRAVVPLMAVTLPLLKTAWNVELQELALMSNIVSILLVTAVHGIQNTQKAAECMTMMISEHSPCAVLARVDNHGTLLQLPQLRLSYQF